MNSCRDEKRDCKEERRECDEERENCGCIHNILKRILLLQRQDFDNENFAGCDKPFLGPVCNSVCYNTRPIQLYNCCTGDAWCFPFTFNGVNNKSNVFRIEVLEDCCCTCRILFLDPETKCFENTNEFFTLDLNCVGAIKCLADTFVELC